MKSISSKLVRVKYFQPEKRKKSNNMGFKLDNVFAHPARYVYCVCTIDGNKVVPVGAYGNFIFVDGKCANFLNEYQAEIVEELDESHLMDEDYYELA